MMRRRSIELVVGAGTLVAPLATLAQVTGSGTVTTGPLRAAAPALGVPLVIILALALAGVAMYRLRRTAGGAVVGLVVVAALAVLAGLGYATAPITISGADCTQQSIHVFDPSGDPIELMNGCPNPIQILDIEFSCTTDVFPGSGSSSGGIEAFPWCTTGEMLAGGASCDLPTCACK